MGNERQYLYEYQNGERVRNLGFMKVDQQMDKCVIQIYVRDMDDVKGILFQTKDERQYMGGWEDELFQRKETPFIIEEEEKMENLPEEETSAEVEIEEYVLPSHCTFEKIQRQELSRLPRKEWRLANNSFLLHGFYNYHHLLYIEENDEIWIGVPGIFHEREKLAANAFGFTHFRRIVDVEIELEENERNTYEDFGYWCRQIPNPKV